MGGPHGGRTANGVGPGVVWTGREGNVGALHHRKWLAAYAAHPRIGEKKAAPTATQQSATWSAGEQSGTAGAQDAVMAELANLNEAYFKKHGFIFICFASGRTAEEMLDLLKVRFENTTEAEIENAAAEQLKITRLRMEKWLRA
ncbi:MAG: OHCU decarboxylase [Flavobacteriales bacterium]|nr:OHCU decarboxylase [Flavobacteriales bacterium]